MGRRKKHEEHENHERWLVSYADMLTVLLALFIVLYASSVINVSKFRAIQNAAAESFGAGPRETEQVVSATNNGGDAEDGPPVVTEPNEDLIEELKKEVEKAGLKSSVKVYQDSRGVVIYFTDRVLFDPGSADVRPAGATILRRLSPVLSDTHHPIVVEGHTDNQPISTAQFPSNWELSTTRATQVLRTLLGGGVPPAFLAASGYADTHPKATNATVGGRSQNRRVEVIVVTPEKVKTSQFEAAAAAGSRRGAGEVRHGAPTKKQLAADRHAAEKAAEQAAEEAAQAEEDAADEEHAEEESHDSGGH